MSAIDQVKKIIDFYKISVSAFEKSIGAHPNSVGTALRNKATLKDTTVSDILKAYPNISPEWLLTGNGPEFRTGDVYAISKQLSDNEKLDLILGKISAMEEDIKEIKKGL